MKRLFSSFLLFVTVLFSCRDGSIQNAIKKKDSTAITQGDTSLFNSYSYREEQDYLGRNKILYNQLSLYDIVEGTDSLELRMWYIPSMWDPTILYVLKVADSRWTLFHYQIYLHRATSEDHRYDDPVIEYFKNPIIDSVTMESVRPQKIDWQTYIDNLQLDSLWNLQTESSIEGATFTMLDGYRCLLELNEKGRYKYLFFTEPDYFQKRNANHKKFIEFQKRLVDPIIYKGMRNP